MLPAEDREFPDAFLSVGGCLVLRADAICFKFDRDHLAPWANGIESALSGN